MEDVPLMDLLDPVPREVFMHLLSSFDPGEGFDADDDGGEGGGGGLGGRVVSAAVMKRNTPAPAAPSPPRHRRVKEVEEGESQLRQQQQRRRQQHEHEHEQWSVDEWRLDNHSLAVVQASSEGEEGLTGTTNASGGSSIQSGSSRLTDAEAATTTSLKRAAAATAETSKRESLRRIRLEKQSEKIKKQAAKREELIRKGAKNCDVMWCCEPRMTKAGRVCAEHMGSKELRVEGPGSTEPHRYCQYCHLLHPVFAFGADSQSICAQKFNLRKRRRAERDAPAAAAATTTTTTTTGGTGGTTTGGTGGTKHNSTPAKKNAAAKPNGGAAIDNSDKDEDVAIYYLNTHRYEALDLKFGVSPAVLAQHANDDQNNAQNRHVVLGAVASLHGDSSAADSMLARAGTPGVASMVPGCTHVTVSGMTTSTVETGVCGDSHAGPTSRAPPELRLRERVARVVASIGNAEILRDERWGVAVAASGADEIEADEVYCAVAVGNRVVAEHEGTSWPAEVRVPLCVVAGDWVTLDMSAVTHANASDVSSSSGVRWFGVDTNTKSIIATAADGSTPAEVSCHVKRADYCSLLSVQMITHGECIGTGFKHVLVLPSDDPGSVDIADEINGRPGTDSVRRSPHIEEEEEENRWTRRRRLSKKLYLIATTDLAWLLAAHQSGAAYASEAVLSRASKIASGLQAVYSATHSCPLLERRLRDIELDLLEYVEEVRAADADDPRRLKFVKLLETREREEEEEEEEEKDAEEHESNSSDITWTWWRGFSLSYLESKYRNENRFVTSSLLPGLRLMGAILYIVLHLKLQRGLPLLVVRDLTLSTILFLTALACTQVAHARLGTRWLYAYPYDGLFWGAFLHFLCLHDTLVFFTNKKIFYLCASFHTFFAFAYRIPPYFVLAQMVGGNSILLLKLWFVRRRWPIDELGADEGATTRDYAQTLLILSGFIPFGILVMVVLLRNETWHRRLFLESQKFHVAPLPSSGKKRN